MKTYSLLSKMNITALALLAIIPLRSMATTTDELSALSAHYSGSAPARSILSKEDAAPPDYAALESDESAASLIKGTLDDAQTKTLEDRIGWYSQRALEISTLLSNPKRTENGANDPLVGTTLDRALFTINATKNILGESGPMNILWVAKFYEDAFRFSLSLANEVAVHMASAEYGRRFSILLGNVIPTDISYPAQATLLGLQILKLSDDLSADPRAETPAIKDLRISLGKIRASQAFKTMLQQLNGGNTLDTRNFLLVLSGMKRVTDKLDQALINAGAVRNPLPQY